MTPTPPVTAARNAVAACFFLNGFCFATWASRIPQVRSDLALSNGGLGLLLLCIAAGSVIALPTTGAAIQRWGTVAVIRLGGAATAIGISVSAVGVSPLNLVWVSAAGLFVYGVGIGVWDVAMNVEGADVERRLARTIMPRFHAGFSFGTMAGAGLGALCVALGVPLVWHLVIIALGASAWMSSSASSFLPVVQETAEESAGERRSAWAAWREPRTVLIGLMVMALAITEGTANDWLAVALLDGYAAADWVGVVGYALFVTAMTLGRLIGPVFLDRFGTASVLWATIIAAMVGVLFIVFGANPVLVGLGIVLWGVGASLGFPVGMSAAATDPVHAAARVSVVSTIGYAAFLAGPPLLGFVGDQVGTLRALLVVAALLLPAMLLVPVTRRESHVGSPR